MHIIKKIKMLKHKAKISFKDNTSIEINPSLLGEFNLYEDKQIESELIKKIKKDSKVEDLFESVLKYVAHNNVSNKKIESILYKKGAKKEEINAVIKKLESCNVIDESSIVENVISYCDSRNYGYKRIIDILQKKKVSQKAIKNVVYNIDREMAHCSLMAESLIKRYKNKNNANLRKSIFSALIRYGFSEEISSCIVSKLHYSQNNELDMLKLDYKKYFSSYSRKYNNKEALTKTFATLQSKGYKIEDIKIMKENSENEMD